MKLTAFPARGDLDLRKTLWIIESKFTAQHKSYLENL